MASRAISVGEVLDASSAASSYQWRVCFLCFLMTFLDGRLTEEDREHIEKAFSRLQNKILHGPISALSSEVHQDAAQGGHSLLEALRKLFRLRD